MTLRAAKRQALNRGIRIKASTSFVAARTKNIKKPQSATLANRPDSVKQARLPCVALLPYALGPTRVPNRSPAMARSIFPGFW